MLRLEKPVPGIAIEPRTPDLRPLAVKLIGPSLKVFEND